MWWTNGYKNWDDSQLKHRLRVSRETLELMLQRIEIYIVKGPTNIAEQVFASVSRELILNLFTKFIKMPNT